MYTFVLVKCSYIKACYMLYNYPCKGLPVSMFALDVNRASEVSRVSSAVSVSSAAYHAIA